MLRVKTFEYDIAISFAEEDRNAALALARTLALNGLQKIYYYPDVPGAVAGRQLKAELSKIYGEQARFAVALLSKDYLKKEYTKLEMEAIRARMAREDDTYLIPVLMEPKLLKKVPEIKAMGCLHWESNPDKIAVLLTNKLGTPLAVPAKQAQEEALITMLQKYTNGVAGKQHANTIIQAVQVLDIYGTVGSVTNNLTHNG